MFIDFLPSDREKIDISHYTHFIQRKSGLLTMDDDSMMTSSGSVVILVDCSKLRSRTSMDVLAI